MNQYYLTEWRALTKATEVTLHLYTVPLKDPSSRNTQGGKLIFHLNKLNNFQPMVFSISTLLHLRKSNNGETRRFFNMRRVRSVHHGMSSEHYLNVC
ncbi:MULTISPECIES: hypothetical protein [unclassified Exiguobacterium]|uniref:Uncharacterized protein n=1 Tax=Exiguobacterium sp. (strain ATCC BAA-1283 / AT1b) TaxID=360911 RepID=C4L1M0_EXISA|nr:MULTISPECIES: hypothetical protein [unclassified Exiguobacterium]ACQ71052.1 hypothetical protein EAT1b_2129 [Exiguobacterium sp. AT1b]